MRNFLRTVATTLALLFLPAPSGRAQVAIDPTGHWEGGIQAPEMLVEIAIDLSVNATGQLTGTFSQPMENIKGLPLSVVRVEGRNVHLLLKPGGSGGGTFSGKLSEDGKTIAGDFTMGDGKFVMPFDLQRKGEARVTPAPKGPAISKSLEGSWNGAIEAGSQRMRVVVTMANRPDGTSTGTVVSPDGTNVEIPIGITESGTKVTIEVPSIGATFTGIMNAAGTEIAGSWQEPKATLPLTLKRANQ